MNLMMKRKIHNEEEVERLFYNLLSRLPFLPSNLCISIFLSLSPILALSISLLSPFSHLTLPFLLSLSLYLSLTLSLPHLPLSISLSLFLSLFSLLSHFTCHREPLTLPDYLDALTTVRAVLSALYVQLIPKPPR